MSPDRDEMERIAVGEYLRTGVAVGPLAFMRPFTEANAPLDLICRVWAENSSMHQPVHCQHCGVDMRLHGCACPGAGMESVPCHDEAGMRKLRLWHWRQVRLASRAREHVESHGLNSDSYRENWAFHMDAVQALNQFFDVGDTAERDDV